MVKELKYDTKKAPLGDHTTSPAHHYLICTYRHVDYSSADGLHCSQED